jgi:hypothetical protein
LFFNYAGLKDILFNSFRFDFGPEMEKLKIFFQKEGNLPTNLPVIFILSYYIIIATVAA